MRTDGQVCINPFHFVLDHVAALKLNFSFPKDFQGNPFTSHRHVSHRADDVLAFTREPIWQVTSVGDAYVFHRVDEPLTHELIAQRVADAVKPPPTTPTRVRFRKIHY